MQPCQAVRTSDIFRRTRLCLALNSKYLSLEGESGLSVTTRFIASRKLYSTITGVPLCNDSHWNFRQIALDLWRLLYL